MGDGAHWMQMTVISLAVTVCFFFISRAKPMPKLSPSRPPASIFCWHAPTLHRMHSAH